MKISEWRPDIVQRQWIQGELSQHLVVQLDALRNQTGVVVHNTKFDFREDTGFFLHQGSIGPTITVVCD